MTPGKLERLGPFTVAVFVGIGMGWLTQQWTLQPSLTVPAATLTFGIVVSGFVATQRNLLLTMGGSQLVRYAVRTGLYKDVLNYLAQCIWAGLGVTFLSVLGMVCPNHPIAWSIWLPIQSALLMLVLCLIIRNEILMFRVVKRYWEERATPRRSRLPDMTFDDDFPVESEVEAKG